MTTPPVAPQPRPAEDIPPPAPAPLPPDPCTTAVLSNCARSLVTPVAKLEAAGIEPPP